MTIRPPVPEAKSFHDWRDGHVVVTGMRDGERVALSHAKKVRWRMRGNELQLDRDVSLSAVVSGTSAYFELHDHEMGRTMWRDLDDTNGFFVGNTLEVNTTAATVEPEAELAVAVSSVNYQLGRAKLQEVLAHLVDYGKIELGTPQSTKLVEAAKLLNITHYGDKP